ncbi:MAG: OFA family MFS transporter [Acidobacteriaceae bacterium]|nr:OFA family MFS transporter [Acidobacteriaceae bacterium]
MKANRWLIALAGVLMQIALGAVYAWSVFRIPLTKAYGWTISQVTITFEIAILVLGFAAFVGGLWMRKAGPRTIAITSAVLYGGGTALAGLATNLTALYLTYGLIAGAGLGLGYIVPIATLIKWFPDKRGMITGIAVAGFGAGALITAPVAQALIRSRGVSTTFEVLGIAYLIIVLLAGLAMRNPAPGYRPAGYTPTASAKARSAEDFTLLQALSRWQWYALWLILFLNVTAGISIISQAAPMAQEISHVSAATAAGLVGLISIANGSGRFLWAWLSDAIGRRTVFLIMFAVQAVAFFMLTQVQHFGPLAFFAFVILLCYGGGFGTMPAFAADFFGSRDVGSIYGLMLTAWGFAALFGPTIIAQVRESTGRYAGAMQIMAVVMIVSIVVPLVVRPPRPLVERELDTAVRT